MLEARDLHKRFGCAQAVAGVSLRLRKGRVHAIVGPNGCGKTTLLDLLTGFYMADRGQILFGEVQGRRIDHLPPSARARMGIGRMFQEPRSIPTFTVHQNLTLCALRQGSDNLLHSGLRSFAENGRDRDIERLINIGGLGASIHRRADELSYGQRRILDFLCLIAMRSSLLLLDEPFAGVDPIHLQVLIRLMAQARDASATVALVSHEMPTVFTLADEVSLMDAGRVVVTGTPEDVLESRTFRDVYLT